MTLWRVGQLLTSLITIYFYGNVVICSSFSTVDNVLYVLVSHIENGI